MIHRHSKYLPLALVALGGMLVLASGCGTPRGTIFPEPETPVLFPPPPERARIAWVGQLQTSADLKPAVPLGEQIGRALFGKKPTHSMLSPYALCTDGADRLFVVDSNAQLVHRFDMKTRKYNRIRPGPKQPFAQPVGIAWDPAGRLFVSDSAAGSLYVFDRNGKLAGTLGEGILERPCGLAVQPGTRRLFVADSSLHQVLVFDADGTLLHRIGGRGTQLGQFNFPTNLAIDHAGRLYVSDSLNFRIQQFSPDLQPVRQIGSKGDMPGQFGQPKGVAVDTEGHVYVVDAHFEAIQVFDSDGTLLLNFGNEGRGPGEFWLPAGIFIDQDDRLWVADVYNRRVQVFDYLPEVTP